MSFARYTEKIDEILDEIKEEEKANIKKIAQKFVETVENDGLIHVFGSGHSHMLSEEVFYRAGGLAVMSPIFDPGVMLDGGAIKSTKMERLSGLGEVILDDYDLQPKDLMIVVSNSGRNAVPIDAAFKAKEEGLKWWPLLHWNILRQMIPGTKVVSGYLKLPIMCLITILPMVMQ